MDKWLDKGKGVWAPRGYKLCGSDQEIYGKWRLFRKVCYANSSLESLVRGEGTVS